VAATVHIVRYADSPAGNMILLDMKGMVFTSPPSGPYDELMYMPGRFDDPSGKAHLMITRIYVSTDASTNYSMWQINVILCSLNALHNREDELEHSQARGSFCVHTE
jgi:hypothetical protein